MGWNDEHGVGLAGHVAPKASFSTTVHIDRKGYSIYHIDKYDEDYLITMPKIHIEGIMTGSLSPELSGTTYIRSSSGYTAKIHYSSKGWMSGKSNSFVASLYHDDHEKEPLYTIEGQWSGEFTIKKAATQEVIEKFSTSSIPKTPLTIAPIVATRRRRDRERRYIHRWTREIEARKRAERDAETREGPGEGVPEEVLLENERGPGRGEAS